MISDRLSGRPHLLSLNLRTRHLPEVLLFEGVESGASKKNLRSHLSGHVLKQITEGLKEVKSFVDSQMQDLGVCQTLR